MELRQLEQFVAVAEELHFTRAAARVHVVQSSLSAGIKALEGELGDTLFVRSSRQVTLTPAGRALLPAARRALAAAEEGRDAVAGVTGTLHGQLNVGAILNLGVVDLPAALAGLRRAHPRVAIRLVHTAAPQLARAVADAELDIAIIDGPTDPDRITRIDLGRQHLILAVRAADELARKPAISLDAPVLARRDFITYRADSALEAQIETACAAAGLARRVACEAGNIQYLVELVQHGAGIAILPPAAIETSGGAVVAVPVTPPLIREITAVIAADRAPTAAATALLGLLAGPPGGDGRGC
jgi:DNA-binding transcriptional LysR family regulator